MTPPGIARRCPGLRLGDDGIWWSASRAQVSYPAEGHSQTLSVEDRSFWFGHRNACIEALVRRHPPAGGGALLDVGGGNGFVAAALQACGFDVALLEPGAGGAANARRRGVREVICATLEDCGIPPASLGAAGLFDVLEHVSDDAGLLGRLHRALVPGGRVYLTVPAHGWLWSQADVDAGHQRRYTLEQVTTLLARCGFGLDHASYFFRPLPLPLLLARSLPYRLGLARAADARSIMRDHAARRSRLAGLVRRALASEAVHIAAGRPMRWGASCIVAAHALPQP
jgi:SAM-dependent methyltransferase